jgi:hypothetical protein
MFSCISLDFYRSLAVGVERAAPEGLPGILAGLSRAQAHETAAHGTGWRLDFLLIRLICPISLILFSFLQTSGGKLLTVAAFFDEGGFQGRDLAI